MAYVGLSDLYYATIDSTTLKYTGATSFGKVINVKPSVSFNDNKLYADNEIAETDTSFNGGTVTLESSDDDDTVFAAILGHTIDAETKEVVASQNDTAPFVGIGYVFSKTINNVKKYKAQILTKSQFHDVFVEGKTRGEKTEFTTPTVEGNIFADASGNYERHNTFATKAEAVKYITDFFKVAA